MYTTTPIGDGTVIRYYYRTLIYDNLSIVGSNRPPLYGERSLAVALKDFSRWKLRLKQKFGDGQSVWTYHAPFCTVRMIIDAR